MPIEFCLVCGSRHDPLDSVICTSNITGSQDSRTSRSSSRMAKAASKESIAELESSISSMTLEEQRKQILREIEELKLENELADLEEMRDKLRRQKDERLHGNRGATETSLWEGSAQREQSANHKVRVRKKPLETPAISGFSCYGPSRGRSQDGRHH